jgi:hypothetical protein
VLGPAERELFERYNPHDRAHSLAVASAVTEGGADQSDPEDRWITQAALLHDVGKVESDPSTLLRVVGTVLGVLHLQERSAGWIDSGGRLARLGRYMNYRSIGAELLAAAGSDQRVIAWALEHHSPAAEWSVPAEGAALLRAADDSV